MASDFTCIVANGRLSLSKPEQSILCVCVFLCVSHFLYSSIDWQILKIVSPVHTFSYALFLLLISFFSPFWSLNLFLTLLMDKKQVKIVFIWASLVAQLVKNPPAMQETWVPSLGREDPLEKGRATHSNILAWRIPWTVQSIGSQRVRHDWVTSTFIFTFRM